MKTITTLLMTSFLLIGTFNTVLARDDARSERTSSPRKEIKVTREASTERSRGDRGETRTTTVRKTQVQIPSQRQNREVQMTSTKTRQEGTVRNEQQNRNNQQVRNERPNNSENRNNQVRNERPNNNDNRNNQVRNERPSNNDRNLGNRVSQRSSQAQYDSRGSNNRQVYNRSNNYYNQANFRYHERQLSCNYCTGRGFTLHVNGLRHLRCNHCEGRGIRIIRELNVNACQLCYNPLHNQDLGCSLEDLAWLETDRIAIALDLSSHQRNRVFDINYRYITHHYNGGNYPTSRRDREIRRVLRLGQVIAFALFLDELSYGDICYNCSNDRY